MSSSASDARGADGGRLGGARADFVASLGRKVGDARELLSALEEDPSSTPARDELRRRLHALGAGSRLLRFDAVAGSLQEALTVLDRGAQAGALKQQDVAFVARVLDDLPALAWGEVPAREATAARAEEADDAPAHPPLSILIVGDEALADALTDEGATGARAFECERTEDVQTALELARAYAPDIVLLDADLPRVTELVESLLEDPLTEPVPIIVIGTFRVPDDSARLVALGVARSFAKPVAPETVRRACDEILDAREGRTMRVTLGEPTLEQLANRLSEELKRALVESVDLRTRSIRVPLGEGTEVLGALWGAIARVQEIVAQRTDGAIRFGGDAPEGAIALAPWLHQDLPGADRMSGRGRGAAADVRLNGRRVVVADDDPGVTWFISDLLRTAGCEVHEALDGVTALELSFRIQPELVVSDILMPGLDGFALCRAVRRDVALRDTPVILLSWKEDLLQRVRELGASAAAYMRKETDSRAMLARVREVLRPRARIEMRLRTDGEVRGRLDGLSPRLLLDLVCTIRKDARVAVRDATFLYEIEIRGGAPRRATRTASDGNYLSGERALANLLGVGAGRFVVSPSADSIRGDLSGTLADQLARPIAAARGALVATTGAGTMNVERILLDQGSMEEYLRATPDPARTLIRRLGGGASPRQMLLAGEVAPNLLEDVLSDLAARCAIRAVEALDGTDLLTPAVEAALAVLKRDIAPHRSLPPNARPSAPSPPAVMRTRAPAVMPSEPAQALPPSSPPSAPAPPYLNLTSSDAPPPPRPRSQGRAPALLPKGESQDDADAPSSLEDAVMRELSDRSPAPGAARGPGSEAPPIIEPNELRPRSSSPPANEAESGDLSAESATLPSFPPDAIVPATASSGEHIPVATPLASDTVPMTAPLPMPVDTSIPRHGELFTSPFAPSVPPPATLAATPAGAPHSPAEVEESPASAPPRSSHRRLVLAFLAFALLGASIAAVLRRGGGDPSEPSSAAPSAEPPPAPKMTGSTMTTAASTSGMMPSSPSSTSADDVPPGSEVPSGYGLIEIAAPAGARVRVDGVVVGTGPLVTSIASPGYHEVRVDHGGRDAKHVVEVRVGKTTRVRSAAPP